MRNTLAVLGAFAWSNQKQRDRWMRVTMIVLPIVWGLLGTIVSSPLALVLLAGILNAVYLMGVAVATLYLTDPRTNDGSAFLVMLVISAVAVFSSASSAWSTGSEAQLAPGEATLQLTSALDNPEPSEDIEELVKRRRFAEPVALVGGPCHSNRLKQQWTGIWRRC